MRPRPVVDSCKEFVERTMHLGRDHLSETRAEGRYPYIEQFHGADTSEIRFDAHHGIRMRTESRPVDRLPWDPGDGAGFLTKMGRVDHDHGPGG